MKTFKEFLIESQTGTMQFWHGGNLENNDETIDHKKGRYEFGAGLYATTHYDTAIKYRKGSRKLYKLTVRSGVEINKVNIPTQDAIKFVKQYGTTKSRKNVIARFESYPDVINANIFNNILINEDAIKPSNTGILKDFLVGYGIDYILVSNAFGWGELMIVILNMNVIIKKEIIKSNEKITEFDLPITWSR